MEDILVDLHVERKFEVYDIEWVIEDFSLATCGDKWSIQSPEFTVRGFHATKWLIILTPASDFVVFALKRCDVDDSLRSVCVEWRLTFSLSGYEKVISIERICDFAMGTEYKENLKSLKNSIDLIKSVESDLMTIHCEMIVHNRVANEGFEPCRDRGKGCLSENLLNLFLSGHDCDLSLRVGRKAILVHKAIVCTRIKKLNLLLEEADTDGEIDVIDLPNVNYEAVMKIMEYVYSGDLAHVLAEPSFAIYDSVQALDMHHLKKCYSPKKLTFRTSLNAQETIFTWVTTDFLNNCDDLIVSPDFSDDCSRKWRLHFFPSMKNYFNYFSILAENIGEAKLGNMRIEFAITDESGGTVFSKRQRREANEVKPFGFEKFIRRSLLRSILTNNTLRLTMKIKQSNDAMSSCIEKHDITLVTSSQKIDSFELLSRNMQKLRECPDFSDALLHNNDVCHGVHKSILTSRCSFFATMLINVEAEEKSIALPNIRPDILSMLLNYIYSGVLPETADNNVFTELREVAISYNLPLLPDLCREVIETNGEIENPGAE